MTPETEAIHREIVPAHFTLPVAPIAGSVGSMNVRFCRCLQVLLLLCLVWSAGCASSKKKVDWESRVGSFRYDEAVIEMGPPDKEARLTDGTIVAQWLTRRGYSFRSYQLLYGGWIQSTDNPPGPDQFITLTFSAEGVLKSWKTVYK